MYQPHTLLVASLALAVLLTASPLAASPVRADGTWLDGPRPNWNAPGAEIPQAPPMDPTVNPRCLDLARPPETDADRQIVAKGWTLFGDYRAGWGLLSVKALSGYDGMCRPLGYQELVFKDGTFIGTISPAPMDSRTDGAGQVEAILGPGQLRATYRRYTPDDPLCCPSGSTSVTFEIDERGPRPVLHPVSDLPVLSFTPEDSGQTVSAPVGSRLVVNLPANPTTGYRWRLADGLDQAVLKHVSEVYEPASTAPGLVGGGGTDHWTFEAAAPGTTTLTLEYARPFEPANVVQTFSLTVTVEG